MKTKEKVKTRLSIMKDLKTKYGDRFNSHKTSSEDGFDEELNSIVNECDGYEVNTFEKKGICNLCGYPKREHKIPKRSVQPTST